MTNEWARRMAKSNQDSHPCGTEGRNDQLSRALHQIPVPGGARGRLAVRPGKSMPWQVVSGQDVLTVTDVMFRYRLRDRALVRVEGVGEAVLPLRVRRAQPDRRRDEGGAGR